MRSTESDSAGPRPAGPPQLAPEPLSERERQVLALLADGRPNREIGRILSISEGTVKTHLKHIFSKLGARNRTEAAIIARSSSHTSR